MFCLELILISHWNLCLKIINIFLSQYCVYKYHVRHWPKFSSFTLNCLLKRILFVGIVHKWRQPNIFILSSRFITLLSSKILNPSLTSFMDARPSYFMIFIHSKNKHSSLWIPLTGVASLNNHFSNNSNTCTFKKNSRKSIFFNQLESQN